jgi:adenylylsulfate kinase-like enzyme
MSAAEGSVVWIIGRPASGKTTLALGLVEALRERGRAALWLDSDRLRDVLTPEPTYSDKERDWFYGVLAHLAELAAAGGAHVVVSATAPQRAHRDALRGRVGKFALVYVRCSEAELKRRDPKGLYRRAEEGTLRNLPGVGAAFEEPDSPELALDSDKEGAEAMLARAVTLLEPIWGIERRAPSKRRKS